MKKWNKLVAGVLSATLLFAGCTVSGDTLASVNGKKIGKDVYEKTLGLYAPSYEMQFGPDIWNTEIEPGVTFSQKFQEEILEKMISDEIVLQDAEKKELSVSEEEINKQFEALKKSIEAEKHFKAILEDSHVDDAFLKEQIKKDMLVKKYYDTVMKENEVKEADVKKYYDEHIDEFSSSKVKASHILFGKKDFTTNTELPQEEVAKKKALAEEVLAMAKSGQNFATLATKYSEDPGSAKNGGDLGYFDKRTMVKEFSDAAFSMKVGDISEIVESEFGFHIIKLFDKKEDVQKFEDVKEAITSNLQYQKYQEVIDNLKKEAKVKKNEDAIKKAREELVKKQEEKKDESAAKDATKDSSETENPEQKATTEKK